MLPPAALLIVDRLVTAVMTLVRAVAPTATAHAVAPSDTASSRPTLPEAAAQTLFFRLSQLAIHLIRISNFGVRAPTKPQPTAQAPDHPEPVARPRPPTRPKAAASLPRRPGWLLAALPNIAPAVAADFRALLADPAIATLLNSSLHRTLRPLLRALGLDAAPPISTPPCPPSPSAKPPGVAPLNPALLGARPPPSRASSRRFPPPRQNTTQRTQSLLTSFSLRYRNSH